MVDIVLKPVVHQIGSSRKGNKHRNGYQNQELLGYQAYYLRFIGTQDFSNADFIGSFFQQYRKLGQIIRCRQLLWRVW